MNPFAIARDTFHILTQHPLNRGRRVEAAKRYLRWQLGSLLAPGQIAVDFVDDTFLLGSFGMTSTSCNVFAGLYEFEDMAFVLHMLRPGELFVDVGANVGVYTVLAGAAGASCVSLEPSPDTYAQLTRNIRLNGMSERVTAVQAAAGAKEGSLRLTSGLGAMNHIAAAGEHGGQEVPVRTLDEILGNRPAKLMKIDVEGFETDVIHGARALLESPSLQGIIMERNGAGARYGFDENALHRELVGFGFTNCHYDPFTRKLDPLLHGEAGRWGNVLYVRGLEEVQDRVKTARRFRVHGQDL